MKRILSIVLAVMLFASCAFADTAFTPADSYEFEYAFNGGEIEVVKAEAGDMGTVDTSVYAGIEGKDYTDEKVYTYNTFMTAMGSGLDWNPHTWETSDDSLILDYTTMGLYTFKLNATANGYSVVPEMAAAMPVDVTADYVGSYGIKEGEIFKAWRIALNENACWSDGTPITADDYIYSMQQALDPIMLNRRADSYYAGDMAIVNAKGYLYQGKSVTMTLGDAYGDVETAIAEGAEGDLYVDMWNFWGLEGALDADGNECPQYVSISDEVLYRDLVVEDENDEEAWVSGKYMYEAYLGVGAVYNSYAKDYMAVIQTTDSATWDEVGLKKIDEYTIDIILEKPMAQAAFYLPYNLSSNWLVKEDLYEACKTYFDADNNIIEKDENGNIPADAVVDAITTTYCTSLDTAASYGPYVLTYYELDKQFTLERNENWYGYSDGNHLGQYQTDRVVYQIIADADTQLLTFLNGDIDDIGLRNQDMETYGSSDYIFYEPQSYTTKISFNTNYEKLLEHGTNSQILVVEEFREAFANALDREHFATSFTASHKAGYGLLNYQYCYDPFTGSLYRDSDAAKAALVSTYGLTYGEGGDYDTLDEAYEAITGYNMDKARELMQTAYDKAVAAGIYDGQSDITIEFEVYQNDTIYVQMFTYLDEQIKAACEGTDFEGKVSFVMKADADYYETMYSGGTDAIFTTWGGAAMAPFGVINGCYTDAADGSGNQMEIGFHTENVPVTMTLDGVEYTYSLQGWAGWMDNNDVENIEAALGSWGDYAYSTQCEMFAVLEECFLESYVTTPVYYRYSALLHSQKVNFATYTYLQVVGFGGMDFYTYNYDDAEWADYCASGALQY